MNYPECIVLVTAIICFTVAFYIIVNDYHKNG